MALLSTLYVSAEIPAPNAEPAPTVILLRADQPAPDEPPVSPVPNVGWANPEAVQFRDEKAMYR